MNVCVAELLVLWLKTISSTSRRAGPTVVDRPAIEDALVPIWVCWVREVA